MRKLRILCVSYASCSFHFLFSDPIILQSSKVRLPFLSSVYHLTYLVVQSPVEGTCLISKAQCRLLSLLFSPGVADVIRVTPSPVEDDSMVHKVGKSLICDPE